MSRDQRHIVKKKKLKRRTNHVNNLDQHNLHNQNNMKCPYCGAEVILKYEVEIKKVESNKFLYVCSSYPNCDSYVTAYQDSLLPKGSVANRSLRDLRIKTHYYFDLLHNQT